MKEATSFIINIIFALMMVRQIGIALKRKTNPKARAFVFYKCSCCL